MVREDLVKMFKNRRSTDPFANVSAGNTIIGHKGSAKVKDVAAVDSVDEIVKMIRRTKLSNIDWWDVNIMLKALISNKVNPEDLQLVSNAIDILNRKKPELFIINGNDT